MAVAAPPALPGLSLDVPSELIKDPRSWSISDIGVWLTWLGIGEHAEMFAARGIDGETLLQMCSETAWSDLGVVDPAQQRVLESAVEPLRIFQDAEGVHSCLALHAMEGPVVGEVFFLGSGGITGGRHSASNGVVLSENYVSRRHFQITRDRAGAHLLQDVGSTTGTFLMVREELALDHAMILQLGTTELTVVLDGSTCEFVATEGPDKDARAVCTQQGLVIGREATTGLCIRDPQISAYHCEVRYNPQRAAYVLDDKYSTNRTWIRLAPDGQPSKRFPLSAGDLFKVGSTLFHVVDPTSFLPSDQNSHVLHQAGQVANFQAVTISDHSDSDDLHAQEAEAEASFDSPNATNLNTMLSIIPNETISHSTGLHWELVLQGETRPVLSPEEYARRLTVARMRVMEQGRVEASRHPTPVGVSVGNSVSEWHEDLQERELTSLQQRMQNSRAQTAYDLQQRRPAERRDEDLCKICYDRETDIVLYPCGHFILCRWCAQRVIDCPVCRHVITDIIRTYKA